ncbi:MAG: hypothetical protein AAFO58_09580, partial [Pseudomonadota bacterium]
MADYAGTLSRVEDYFDRSATKVWDQLTSDAPVSKVRATVRAGRDRMRAVMLDQLGDLRGKRILDAGCGTGMAAEVMARAGLAAHALGSYWAFNDAMFALEGEIDASVID